MLLSARELREKLTKLDSLSKEGVEKEPNAIPLTYELLSDVIAWIEAHDTWHFEQALATEHRHHG